MSDRTWVMMAIVLGINWGGFVAMLIYGIWREGRKRQASSYGPGDELTS